MRFNVFCILFVVVLSSFGCSTESQARPKKGIWTSDRPEMRAHITRDTIKIHYVGDDWSALYWKGTWSSKIKDGKRFTSIADKDALDAALLGSTLKRKPFLYKNGKISFSLTFMGITRTVYLTKK